MKNSLECICWQSYSVICDSINDSSFCFGMLGSVLVSFTKPALYILFLVYFTAVAFFSFFSYVCVHFGLIGKVFDISTSVSLFLKKILKQVCVFCFCSSILFSYNTCLQKQSLFFIFLFLLFSNTNFMMIFSKLEQRYIKFSFLHYKILVLQLLVCICSIFFKKNEVFIPEKLSKFLFNKK